MSSKEQHLFEIETFCNNINAFTDTFDQLNASLMKKYTFYVYIYTKLTPNFWLVV